jgi:dienelactone hydrolase
MKFKSIALLVGLFSFSISAHAEIKTKVIEYKEGDTTLEGYLAYDTAGPAKKPGILIVHDWLGLGPNTKMRAEMLAKLGYVAFAADIYGKGVRPDQKEAGKVAGTYKNNRPLMRARVNAGLSELEKQPGVDTSKIAAIGYCFGGTTVLELARSGANINGVVTFHGGLDSLHPEDAKQIKAKILILHGEDDPYVPADQVAAVEKELNDAKVDWQMIKYSGAVHAFTIKEAGNDNSKGAAYNEKADKRSWQAMKDFFAEIFK